VNPLRRRTLLAAGSLLLLRPAVALAQARPKRIGLLWTKSTDDSSTLLAAFREGLRDLGYVEGRDVEIDEGSLVMNYSQLAEAARALVGRDVDVMFCAGVTAVTAASKATLAIPIVMLAGTDPVKAGFAESLARPGKNITGITTLNAQLLAKRLEILKQAVPALKLVGIPLNSESMSEAAAIKALEPSARGLGLDLRPVPVRTIGELDAAMEAAAKAGVKAFAPLASTIFSTNPKTVVAAIQRTRLPAIYVDDEFTRAGALMSYGPRLADTYRRAAVFVVKILKGAKPRDIPIEAPTKFDLVINLRAAKAIGLAFPRELELRADKVME
jgi:putative ABC transport system substrate-binding protein